MDRSLKGTKEVEALCVVAPRFNRMTSKEEVDVTGKMMWKSEVLFGANTFQGQVLELDIGHGRKSQKTGQSEKNGNSPRTGRSNI